MGHERGRRRGRGIYIYILLYIISIYIYTCAVRGPDFLSLGKQEIPTRVGINFVGPIRFSTRVRQAVFSVPRRPPPTLGSEKRTAGT